MTSGEQWGQIKEIAYAALEHPTAERAAYLEQACPSAEIRAEVESLLAHEATGFLEASIVTVDMGGRRLEAGTRLGNFEIVELIGSGGMGDVYRGVDTRLGRNVAIKVLPPEFAADPDRRSRFEQEARAAAALNHPHIAVVHDVGVEETGVGDALPKASVHYIVQEFLEGETLGARLKEGAIAPRRVIDLAIEITEGLAAAHAAGIVHRDLKPDNIFITRDGHAKLLDFGVAKLGAEFAERRSMTEMRTQHVTAAGGIVGTTAYMAPEQIRGHAAETQSDLWALGVLIYLMTTGQHPFLRDTPADTASAILDSRQEPIEDLVKDAPAHFEAIIEGLLQKKPGNRPTVGDVLAQLELARSSVSGQLAGMVPRWRPSPALVVATLIVLGVGSAWAYRAWARAERVDWARLVALPEIERLFQTKGAWAEEITNNWPAFLLAEQVREVLGDDPELEGLWEKITLPHSFVTEPEGVDVEVRPYRDEATPWRLLGKTPLIDVDLPIGFMEVRLVGAGLETVDDIMWNFWANGPPRNDYRMAAAGTIPDGMVLVDASSGHPWGWLQGYSRLRESGRIGNQNPIIVAGKTIDGWQLDVPKFLIDKNETTNTEYMRFIEDGGYSTPEYWPQFERAGRVIGWEEGIAGLVDLTELPGPSIWVAGGYPAGQARWPVSGLSWYEAAAFCAWQDKSLPTLMQWRMVGVTWATPAVAFRSRLDADTPAAVDELGGITRFGTRNMAGNVREWVYNGTDEGRRYNLGGGWDDPPFVFSGADASDPFERVAKNGVRCLRNLDSGERLAELRQPISRSLYDYRGTPVASDEVFEAYRAQFDYDPRALDGKLESTKDEADWRHETVSFTSAYDQERVIAHLLFPRHVEAPYQTVIYMPGVTAFGGGPSEDTLPLDTLLPLVRSGRAVVYPVLYGAHERSGNDRKASGSDPDQWIRFGQIKVRKLQDVRRVIDYLKTRDEIDATRIGYLGSSWGAKFGGIALAVEPRFRAAVLISAGLPGYEGPPATSEWNYLPRVTVPTLMLSGRLDWMVDYEVQQRAFYEALGSRPADNTQAPDKDIKLFPSGHRVAVVDWFRESRAWFDKYMGEVDRSAR